MEIKEAMEILEKDIHTEVPKGIMEDKYTKTLAWIITTVMRWKEICARTGYCWQYVHKKHSDALKNFKYAIECDTQPVI